MTKIETQITAARRQAAAAQAQVTAISNQLLAKLLTLSHRQAANYVRDRRLTPADRAALQTHLQKQLPTRPPMRAVPRQPKRLKLKSILVWLLRHQVLLAGCAALAIIGGIAWTNTPQTIGVGRLVDDLDVHWPDGVVQNLGDTYAVIGHHENEWLIRIWRPFRGYETAHVPFGALVSAR